MVVGLMPGMSLTAYAATFVSYKVASVNATTHAVTFDDASCETYTVVTADTTTFEDGKWYVVSNSVTVSSRITVTGTVNLILCDGATLTAGKGITVNSSNTLNIYAQSAGTGELSAGNDGNAASIGGGARYQSGGTVNIHGGNITAIGGYYAAGIGGALDGGNGEVNIYGGNVTAQGNNFAAGIGGYSKKSGGTVSIYGGTVNASGSINGVGIGIGGTEPGSCIVNIYGGDVIASSVKQSGIQGTVNIGGGTVTANGGTYDGLSGYSGTTVACNGISGTVTISGGTVTATGGSVTGTVDSYGGNIYASSGIGGTVTISGGTVVATGGNATADIENYGGNIYVCDGISGIVTINGGTVTATGGSHTGSTTNYRGTTEKGEGFGGSLTLGTGMYLYGGTSANPESDLSNYRAGAGDYTGDRYVYMTVNNVVPHIHSFTYTATGATITAACTASCDITEGLALTISAPTELTYDGSAKAATLSTGYNTTAFPGEYMIKYYQGANEVEAANVKAAGDYTAKVTVGEAIASVDFTIAKANPSYTVPGSLTAIYGKTLADVTLPDGWTWKDNSASVGNVGTNTFKANFTPTDTENYNTVENVDVKVNVSKGNGAEALTPDITAWTSDSIYVTAVSGQEYVIVKTGETPDWSKAVTPDEEGLEFDGLTPATEYTVYTRVKETENTLASNAKKTDVLTSLNGWETQGEPKTGETITIIPDPENTEGLTWQWYYAEENDEGAVVKSEVIEGATSSSYAVKEADVGKYLYYVISKGGKELEQGYSGPVKITINPTVALEDWAYGEKPNTPVVTGNTGNGAVSFTYAEKGSDEPESETVPTLPGSYTVYAYIEESDNYAYGYAEADFTITKGTPAVTAPTARTLTYNGFAQELVNAGSVSGGTLYYAVTTENKAPAENLYTTSIPSKTDAGTYYVWYKARGDANHSDSEPDSVTVTIGETETVATPTFSPEAGTYTEAQSVTISCETTGATIYYTTDGSDPSSSSTKYSSTIAVGETTTIKAIAVKDGMTDSSVASATYTINIPPQTVATPAFSPDAGTYTEAQSVTISCETTGATIYYTTDGSDPSDSSTKYSSAIAVGETTTIKAIAVKDGMTDSSVASATYTINIPPQTVATPAFSPDAGTYTEAQSVTISCETTGATIYYTTDGSNPSASSTAYSGAITVGETTTIKAIAVKEGMTDSSVASTTYTISEGPEPSEKTWVDVDDHLSDDSISDDLKNSDFNTVSKIEDALETALSITTEEEKERSKLVDVKLMVSTDGGSTWTAATAENFPAGGIDVVLPYPDGTNGDEYSFSVAHMIGTSANGKTAGEIEKPGTTNTSSGISTHFNGLSPVMITWTKNSSPSKKDDSKSKEKAHTHHYVWETIEATEDSDGELRYKCDICGDIQTRVPITAYYVFNKNTTDKIRKAGQGATVKIETSRFISFHKMVMDALAERPDVTLEISFLDGEYKGNRVTVTIPAGTDALSLLDENGFVGFLYLASKYGYTLDN